MKCACCPDKLIATHYAGVGGMPGKFAVVCERCAKMFGVTQLLPKARLIPGSLAWQVWMKKRGDASARRERLQEAAHAYLEDSREPA